MIIYNGYPLSIVVAVSFHTLVLAALLYLQRDNRTDVLDIETPPVIKAVLVAENPQVRNEELERQRLTRIEDQRLREQREAEQQRQADLERQRQLEQERQAAEEAERQRQATLEEQRQRELEQQQQREREQEREREAEEQRQRELAEQRRRQEEAAAQERQRQAEEEAAASAADIARTEQEQVQSYSAFISQAVTGSWSRPPSARNNMTAVLRLTMIPTGQVLNVEIIRSSGDPAFDRSAEDAVHRAKPFRELQGMPIKLFEDYFRTFTLTFRPEDLLN
ncbi:MAG: cell envelope integrity protein TolA [Pseudohongiellaceae bacterium]